MKNILVTGGGGYIGVELVKHLLTLNYHVSVLDLFIYGKDKLQSHPNLKLITADIRDIDKVKATMKEIDAVIHLACVSNDPGYEMDAEAGNEINFLAFEPIVKAAIDMKVTRFLYPSSCSVYGKDCGDIVNESFRKNPLTDYATCKAKCEEVLKAYSSKQFYTTIFRPATVCGYSDRQRFDLTVNALINEIYHKDEVSLKGAKRIRPSLHIMDMVRAYEMALLDNNTNLSGEVYNLGYENNTVMEIAEEISSVMEKKINFFVSQSNDERSYAISSEKVKTDLNFTPKFFIKDAAIQLASSISSGKLSNTFDEKFYYNKRIQKEMLISRFAN